MFKRIGGAHPELAGDLHPHQQRARRSSQWRGDDIQKVIHRRKVRRHNLHNAGHAERADGCGRTEPIPAVPRPKPAATDRDRRPENRQEDPQPAGGAQAEAEDQGADEWDDLAGVDHLEFPAGCILGPLNCVPCFTYWQRAVESAFIDCG